VILMLCGLGLPMPEDVALLVGGFLAHEGVTRYPITRIVALLGVIAGDNSLYIIERGLGSNLLSYFGLKRSPPTAVPASRTINVSHPVLPLRALGELSATALNTTGMARSRSTPRSTPKAARSWVAAQQSGPGKPQTPRWYGGQRSGDEKLVYGL